MMIQWLTENWLATYGALVGTIALALNFTRFIHLRKRDTVQLKVSGEPHEHYEGQVQLLIEGREKEAYKRPSLVEVYKIRITNKGSIPVHLKDAGVITKDGKTISVLTPKFNGNDSLILRTILGSDQRIALKILIRTAFLPRPGGLNGQFTH